jgi:hypothetical protein
MISRSMAVSLVLSSKLCRSIPASVIKVPKIKVHGGNSNLTAITDDHPQSRRLCQPLESAARATLPATCNLPKDLPVLRSGQFVSD